jgi:hypothetical protein
LLLTPLIPDLLEPDDALVATHQTSYHSIKSVADSGNENQNRSSDNVGNLETEETLIKSMSLTPRTSSFSIVVKLYPIEKWFKDFWNTYGGVMGLVGGGFATGISALLIDRFKNRSKYRSRKFDDWY